MGLVVPKPLEAARNAYKQACLEVMENKTTLYRASKLAYEYYRLCALYRVYPDAKERGRDEES